METVSPLSEQSLNQGKDLAEAIIKQNDAEMKARLSKVLNEAAADFYGLWGNAGADMFDFMQDANFAQGFTSPVIVPPYYRLNQKRGELLPIYLDENTLRWLRDRSRKLCAENPYAICALDNRKNYACGEKGLKIKAVKAKPECLDRLVDAVQKVIDLWYERNEVMELTSEIVEGEDTDGEVFVRSFEQSSGLLLLRPVEPEHVRAPGSSYLPHQSFGIQTPEDDIMKREGYWIVENPLMSWFPEFVPASEVRHFKQTKRSAKRGLPFFYACEKLLRSALELLQGVVVTANIRARYAVINKFAAGVVNDAISKFVQSVAKDTVTSPVDGSSYNIQRVPFGSIKSIGANQEIEFPSAQMDSAAFEVALQMVLRAVAARANMPEWMLTADASGANYTSTLIAEAPSTKSLGNVQERLCRRVGVNKSKGNESLAWQQVQAAVRAGVLSSEALTLVSLTCEGPSLIVRDRNSEATRFKTYVDMKVMAPQQVQGELGIDSKKTHQLNIEWAEEQKKFQQSPQSQGIDDEQSFGGLVPPGNDGTDEDADGNPPMNHPPLVSESVLWEAVSRLIEAKYSFSSTQFNLPAAFRRRVLARAAMIADEDLAGNGRESNPHITIKYGLHTDDAAAIEEVVSGFGPVEVEFRNISIFPAKEADSPPRCDQFDVVKIDIESPRLRRLNAMLADKLEHTDSHPVYNPHVTLAYVKPGEGAKYAGRCPGLSGRVVKLDVMVFSTPDGKATPIVLGPKQIPTNENRDEKFSSKDPRWGSVCPHCGGTNTFGARAWQKNADGSGGPANAMCRDCDNGFSVKMAEGFTGRTAELKTFLDELGERDGDGLYVWINEKDRLAIVDFMDWFEGDEHAIKRAVSKWTGDEARIVIQNEGGKPQGDDWVMINRKTKNMESVLYEAGFTGTITDELGRKVHFEDGKRVKASGQAPPPVKDDPSPDGGEPHEQHIAKMLNAVKSIDVNPALEEDAGKHLAKRDPTFAEKHPLVKKAQTVVMAAGRALAAAAQSVYPIALEAAKSIAKEQGYSDETIDRVSKVASVISVAQQGHEAIPAAMRVALGGNIESALKTEGGKGSIVPLATIAFLAVNAFNDPFMVAQHALKAAAAERERSQPKTS